MESLDQIQRLRTRTMLADYESYNEKLQIWCKPELKAFSCELHRKNVMDFLIIGATLLTQNDANKQIKTVIEKNRKNVLLNKL